MITLQRTGLPDLTFDGDMIGRGGRRPEHAKPEWTMRWHVVTLYRTTAGTLVGQVEYVTEIERENDVTTVFAGTDRKSDLIEQLSKYDPYQYVDQYPDHPRWDQREERRKALITARYKDACVEAYAGGGIVETLD